MFLFIAAITDDRLYELIDDLQKKRNLTKTWAELSKVMRPSLNLGVRLVAQKSRSLDSQRVEDLASEAELILYNVAQKYPLKDSQDIFKKFRSYVIQKLKWVLPVKLSEMISPVTVKEKVREGINKVRKYIDAYVGKYKKNPSIKQIAKDLHYSDRQINGWVQEAGLFKNNLQLPDPQKAETQYMSDREMEPDKIYQDKERKQMIKKTLRKVLPTFADYEQEALKFMIDTGGRRRKELIGTHAKFKSDRTLQYLWQRFKKMLYNDKEFREYYIYASQVRHMIKMSTCELVESLNDSLYVKYGSEEEFLNKLING